MTGERKETITKLNRLIELLTPSKSGGYATAAVRLRDARQLFHEIVAMQATDVLNTAWQEKPHETLQEKQDIARWINSECRAFGVAVKCPRTGEAAIIHADPVPPYNGKGRFQVVVINKDLGRKRTFSSASPFDVELMPHFERREPLAERWATKSGKQL